MVDREDLTAIYLTRDTTFEMGTLNSYVYRFFSDFLKSSVIPLFFKIDGEIIPKLYNTQKVIIVTDKKLQSGTQCKTIRRTQFNLDLDSRLECY